jgi:hypothetical protein
MLRRNQCVRRPTSQHRFRSCRLVWFHLTGSEGSSRVSIPHCCCWERAERSVHHSPIAESSRFLLPPFSPLKENQRSRRTFMWWVRCPAMIYAIVAGDSSTRRCLGRHVAEKPLYRYAPDKWSIRQRLNHVTDTERGFTFRALWFARGFDAPSLLVASARRLDHVWRGVPSSTRIPSM